MPIVHIHLTDAWSPSEARTISDAIHDALVEAFRIPDHDYVHRVHRCGRDEFVLAPGKPERYAVVEMSIFPGRTVEAKERLFQGLVERFGRLGIAPDQFLVSLHENPLENWCVRGVPGHKLSLGFELKV